MLSAKSCSCDYAAGMECWSCQGKFLPAAERFGLICDLDRWMVSQAAHLAARGHAVNVNLSACSLGDVELAASIEKLLADAHADPN